MTSEVMQRSNTVSVLALPVMAEGALETKKENSGWYAAYKTTLALLEKAYVMVTQAEQTIYLQQKRIAELEALVTTDDLTGLTNRRGFFDAFLRELDRANRGLCHGGLLLLIDLDNFKHINDHYGHLAGDACLRLVGRTLASEIRVMDIAARLGGDEFVLLFTDTSLNRAAARAQMLTWRLNNLSLLWQGTEIPIHVSVGLREYKAGDQADTVFNDADIRLYADKQANRGAAAE